MGKRERQITEFVQCSSTVCLGFTAAASNEQLHPRTELTIYNTNGSTYLFLYGDVMPGDDIISSESSFFMNKFSIAFLNLCSQYFSASFSCKAVLDSVIKKLYKNLSTERSSFTSFSFLL